MLINKYLYSRCEWNISYVSPTPRLVKHSETASFEEVFDQPRETNLVFLEHLVYIYFVELLPLTTSLEKRNWLPNTCNPVLK